MALLFMDGFDHVDDGYELAKWDYYTATSAIVYGAGYGATGGWGCYIGGGYGNFIAKYFNAVQTVIFGIRLRVTVADSTHQLMAFTDNTVTHITITPTIGGTLIVKRGSTVLAETGMCWTTSTWCYLEIKLTVSNTVGAIELRVNGVTELDLSGVDTCQGTETCTRITLSPSASNAVVYLDDCYICDTTGTENNDFLGDVTVRTIYPTSDGTHSDFTPSTGVDNYATVDEPQLLGVTDYNTVTAIGAKDTFGMTALTGSAPILAVQTVAAVNNTTTGTINVRGISRSGATPADNEGSDFALSQTVKAAMDIFEKEPTDDVAWTVAKVNAAEFGIKVQS